MQYVSDHAAIMQDFVSSEYVKQCIVRDVKCNFLIFFVSHLQWDSEEELKDVKFFFFSIAVPKCRSRRGSFNLFFFFFLRLILRLQTCSEGQMSIFFLLAVSSDCLHRLRA
jgi:hypothetical protein